MFYRFKLLVTVMPQALIFFKVGIVAQEENLKKEKRRGGRHVAHLSWDSSLPLLKIKVHMVDFGFGLLTVLKSL